MLLRFWEGLLCSDPAGFVIFRNGVSIPIFTSRFLLFMEESSEAGVLFLFLQSEEVRTPNKSAGVILASVPWPQQLLSSSTQRENSRKGWGQCQPSISVLPALNAVTSNQPCAFKKVEKNRCHSTNLRSINHCPQWWSLQTPFLKLMFWYLLWFLLCSVSEFQQVKYNKILSLAQFSN